MTKRFFSGIFLCFILSLPIQLFAQEHTDFKLVKQVKTSSVKDQANSGTCWSYATISFFETELLRKGKPEIDLAEMFAVRNCYIYKGVYYVRLHGLSNFSQGGQAHDVTNVMRKAGMVPQEIYPGLNYGEKENNHSEIETILKNIVQGVVKNENRKLSSGWLNAFTSVCDSYFGKYSEQFTYQGKNYTSQSFLKDFMQINPDDYIEITSYTHHPFYSKFDLEIPDNWSHDYYYNVPVEELLKIMDFALDNGYSVCWDGDVSEKGFKHGDGVANLTEQQKNDLKDAGMQNYRQTTFDNYTTTDDHLMHITGYATNKTGEKYYLTKNSWGCENICKGFLYMSEQFVGIKTVAIMIHKDAVPADIKKKLGIN